MNEEYLEICEEECGKNVTKEEIVNSLDCNFCDVPYIILEIEREEQNDRKFS